MNQKGRVSAFGKKGGDAEMTAFKMKVSELKDQIENNESVLDKMTSQPDATFTNHGLICEIYKIKHTEVDGKRYKDLPKGYAGFYNKVARQVNQLLAQKKIRAINKGRERWLVLWTAPIKSKLSS
jgi:hypothetical protein